MNLYKVLTSPAFHRLVLDLARHLPGQHHPDCRTVRLASYLMFGDEEDEHRKEAARAIDTGEVQAAVIYDADLWDMLPEVAELAAMYDVPLADVAQAALAMARVYFRPPVRLLNKADVMERLGITDTPLRRLERQGRIPPTVEVTDDRPLWTEPCIEGWAEVVEENKKHPYIRGVLVYPPFDGKRLSEYTTQQWLRRRKQQK